MAIGTTWGSPSLLEISMDEVSQSRMFRYIIAVNSSDFGAQLSGIES